MNLVEDVVSLEGDEEKELDLTQKLNKVQEGHQEEKKTDKDDTVDLEEFGDNSPKKLSTFSGSVKPIGQSIPSKNDLLILIYLNKYL